MCCKIKNEKWAVCTHIQQKDEKKVEKANLLVQKNYAIMKLLSIGLKTNIDSEQRAPVRNCAK